MLDYVKDINCDTKIQGTMHQVQQSCDSYDLNISIKETKRVINSLYLLMSELLSNISLFVGQLYADKSLALRALDLLCFTTDL